MVSLNKKAIKYLHKKYPNWDVSTALRYLPIMESIITRFEGDKKIKILDVGSGEFGLSTYMHGYDITGTDIDFGEKRLKNFRIVKASAEKLPFKDNSFDVAISVDMMEHIPSKIRKKAVYEMVRVSKNMVYLAYPSGRLSPSVDRLIAKYYAYTHGEELEFLKEHEKYGLPDDKIVIKDIKDAAKKYKKNIKIRPHGNTNILLWIFLLGLGFSENKYLTNIYHKMLFLIPILGRLHFPPTYRSMIRVDIEG